VSSVSATSDPHFGPWNPGIQSQVPAGLRPLCTIFRPGNVDTSVAEAEELRELTGLDLAELVLFRPERLALHELLIRVTADLSVPDGTKIEDLGINFRRMTAALLERAIEPNMDALRVTHDALRKELGQFVDGELATLFSSARDAAPATSAFAGLFARLTRKRARPQASDADASRELRFVADWEARSHAAGTELQGAACRALARVVSLLLVAHGSVGGCRELIASLATRLATNSFGSEEIGRLIAPWIVVAAESEGYMLLPRQEQPVVMNTKGASASGKSTLRPLQKSLAGDIGVSWSEFALISPDIWRKQLLDYATLGPEFRYAGSFTAEELQIVDHKLDRYMARKAERGQMPHLLIDRFRFDSFAPDSHEPGSNLLTRFGRTVYLFFMITPPASLVERAWNRGLEFGRYKAVDDTLAHGVEAYSGMPDLFFTWAQRADKRVHFEFLDNSVAFGERPRTVAFGWNDELNILDVKHLLDIERYRRVDVDAIAPTRLYRDPTLLAPECNTRFLRDCVTRLRRINLADASTGRIYLRIESGRVSWADPEPLERALADLDTRAALGDTIPTAMRPGLAAPDRVHTLFEAPAERPLHTLGRWGGR
jgi:hypothetical protein